MGCLCSSRVRDQGDWESVSLEIQCVGTSEFLVWHRFCEICQQHWFVKIDLPMEEPGRQIFMIRGDWRLEKNE